MIVDASGKLVSTEIRKGLDEDARKKILDYLHPPLMEKPMNQKPSLHQMEHYQKFYENGEYVRAVESTTEQNYNMIDGCANNLPKPRIINGRESVLDKLRIRQMAREKQKSSQEQSADMERNRKWSVVARMQRVPCKQALEEIFQDRFVELQNGFLKYRDA